MFWQILFGKSGFTSKIIDGLLKGNISCYSPLIFPTEFIPLQEIISIFYRPNILESNIKLLINKALKQGININVLDKDNDNTILLIALKHHYYDVAELLIKRGANCNTPDQLATTPLHAIVENTHNKMSESHVLKLLLQKGASTEMRNLLDQTPLQLAICKGKKK